MIVAKWMLVFFQKFDVVTGFRYALSKNRRSHVTGLQYSHKKSNTSGDQRDVSIVPIGFEVNGEANKKIISS